MCSSDLEIAKEAEFFSFGTNDLTQMTFGFSRDDAAKFLGAYYENKIYESDPFQHLDQVGVGKLVKMAAHDGRETRPDLGLGICGEHGGDPVRQSRAARYPVQLRRNSRYAPYSMPLQTTVSRMYRTISFMTCRFYVGLAG